MIFAVVISQSKQSLQNVRKHPRLSLIQHHGQHHCLLLLLTALSEDRKIQMFGFCFFFSLKIRPFLHQR